MQPQNQQPAPNTPPTNSPHQAVAPDTPSPQPAPQQPPAQTPQQQQPMSPPQTNPSVHPLGPETKPMATPQKPKKPAGKADNTTQKSLLISEIRDGIVIMKDGSLRAVVMCKSINFDLMSPEEREGIEYAYQSFLNSLYFPVQIFIRSQHINLDKYIDKLEKKRQGQDNILLALLMEDYIAYVKYLIDAANIMDKQFYVVVPYYPANISVGGISSGAQKFTELLKPKERDVVVVNEADFAKHKQELTQQVRIVVNGLSQIGIHAIPLNTQELIELYYNVYNPITSKQEKLGDITQLDAAMIEKGEGEAKQILPGEGL